MLPYWFELLKRAVSASVTSINQSWGGVTFAILVALLYLVHKGRAEGRQAMKAHFTKNLLKSVAIALIAWSPFFIWNLAKAVYDDHTQAVKKAFEDGQKEQGTKDREAISLAQQNNQHPKVKYVFSRSCDRVLTTQQSDHLYRQLKKYAEAGNNSALVTGQLGALNDREAFKLSLQLEKIFTDANWKIKWKGVPDEDVQKLLNRGAPIGIGIWVDDMNRGTFLSGMFRDAELEVNIQPLPPNMKGTVIWVGYKQYP